MPLQETSGNATADAYGGGAAAAVNYIENVFSTYLYDATGATQSITNNIDLSTKGGLVWIKDRTIAYNNCLFDTERGVNKQLYSNATNAQVTAASSLTNFNTNGFTLGADSSFGYVNNAGSLASWTFRKQPKFFDIVTYTGNGSDGRSISHNLGSTPGSIIVKCTNASVTDWFVWHRSIANNGLLLNTTSAAQSYYWSPTDTPTSTNILVSNTYGTNVNGQTYVAYLFAHNAGGFGLTGTDNVISCGSFSCNGSTTTTVNLGYEPQWLMVKLANGTDSWYMFDNMRGLTVGGNDAYLQANVAAAESSSQYIEPTATGFDLPTSSNFNNAGQTYIYIAIRRGPMKVPTDATKVFYPSANSSSTGVKVTTGFPVDLQIGAFRSIATGKFAIDRLRGASSTTTEAGQVVRPNTTDAEFASTYARYWDNTGYQVSSAYADNSMVEWNFQRAPSFFDEVCFDENVVNTTAIPHNLTVVPELVIYKKRSSTSNWITFSNVDFNKYLRLNTTDALTAGVGWSATSTTVNLSAVTGSATSVAYLFATCAGVSKVGSYTGTGATQTVSCGFTGGARWVMVKRTDSTGDWYVWDTARGMVSGTDPSLLLNSTAAEVNANSVYTATGGFQIVSTAAGINASGGTYIFLAIA